MLKTTKKGFTIIEVVIVLVIGAVIMLGVFLVVPGLQRSAQNQRRQDIARQFLSGIEQFKANNGGRAVAATDIGAITTQIGNIALTDPDGTVTTFTINADPTRVHTAVFQNNTRCVDTNFGPLGAAPGSSAVVIAIATPTTNASGTPFQRYCISN